MITFMLRFQVWIQALIPLYSLPSYRAGKHLRIDSLHSELHSKHHGDWTASVYRSMQKTGLYCIDNRKPRKRNFPGGLKVYRR